LWLIPGLPLAAALLVGFFGRVLRSASHWPVLLAAAGSCGVSLWTLADIWSQSTPTIGVRSRLVNWFSSGGVVASAGLEVDPVSAVMLAAITFIGFWIAVYSVGYMHGDPGYSRFFAVLSGFLFSMVTLVLTSNLLVLYACWEGVGLCSYLLVGFWFAKPTAAAAARKAFLVTRIGDVIMILGVFLLWQRYGSLDLRVIFDKARATDPWLTTACLLLFGGAVGKSAQFPLHVWLPDAMEGPTPVSALIHAATMVTAGVYLIARCMPLFVLAPPALATVAVIGSFTALLAALIALTQDDLKRVMAYSTVSQLGYMFSALGCGQGKLAAFAVTAAIFHLFTHAFFKALLFLASGSVMHAMGNVIDMNRFGGLRKVLPVTHVTFFCGAMALAGLPPFAGFWSKDEILAIAQEAGHGSLYPALYFAVFAVLTFTALLTAFYTARAYFRTFWGELVVPPEAGSHGDGHDDHHAEAPGEAHESPAVMTIPLVVLAVGAVFAGGVLALGYPLDRFFHRAYDVHHYLDHFHHEHNVLLMASSGVLSLAGIVAAWFLYVVRPGIPARLAAAVPGLYKASQNRFYFDELYNLIAVGPLTILAMVSRVADMLVDGVVDLVGSLPRFLGWLIRPIQNGLVQFYGLAMLAGLTVFLAILAFSR
jgi:NADH-quinone oxidoreductase subunit L